MSVATASPPQDGTGSPSAATSAPSAVDARFSCDETRLDALRSSAPWSSDPKYFTSAAFSPSATMKMLMHCHSGVEKGVKKGGNPIEVMGLMLGRPDPDTPRTLVITDVFPLPIEGFETRVIADDEDVVNHMITLGESLERTRKEKFMGWYHSHPFDVGINSHCYLSQTDLTTQLQWQRAEDPHGNPFLAVVIDPLRSLAKNSPELKAFRAYPPEYNSPITNECPDGSIVDDEQTRLERWGSCWARYYELGVEYYMSESARSIMGILTQNFLWIRTLGSTPMLEVENRDRFPDRVAITADKVKELNLVRGSGGVKGGAPSVMAAFVEGLGGIGAREGPARSRSGGGSGAARGGGGLSGASGPSPAAAFASASASGSSSSHQGGRVRGSGSVPPLAGSSSQAVSGSSVATISSADDEGELGKACKAVVELATEKLHGNIGQGAKKGLFL